MAYIMFSRVIAGIFALLATVFSFYQVREHLLFNSDARMRKYVIRILLMVPIYCLESWFGLVYSSAYLFFDSIRDCYEALVIYSFYCLLVEYLGGEDHIEMILSRMDPRGHIFPFCFLRGWDMGHEFWLSTKIGVLQYVAVKPFLSAITFILTLSKVYCDGEFNPACGYPYIAFFTTLSQAWAVYCLVLFYYGTREHLAPMKPVSKFLCIKLVIFATFWQSVLIAMLVGAGIISSTEKYSADSVATGLQDFIICIEMLVAAIVHTYAFRVKDFLRGDTENMPILAAPLIRTLVSAANVTDVARDIHTHILPERLAAAGRWGKGACGAGSGVKEAADDSEENKKTERPETVDLDPKNDNDIGRQESLE
eukprot:101174_1